MYLNLKFVSVISLSVYVFVEQKKKYLSKFSVPQNVNIIKSKTQHFKISKKVKNPLDLFYKILHATVIR